MIDGQLHTPREISLLWFFCIIFLCVPAQAHAGNLSPSEIAGSLQAAYNKITTLQATFDQEISSKMARRKRTGSGTLVLVKPGLMRWDYQLPDQQVFICDGENILMYFAKENQMHTSSAKQYLESDVMYSFFAGTADITRDFEISGPTEAEEDIDDSSYRIKLIPKRTHPQIDEITVWADRSSFLLRRLKVVDKFGSITDMTFNSIVLNKDVDLSKFAFSPPEGTEIISQ